MLLSGVVMTLFSGATLHALSRMISSNVRDLDEIDGSKVFKVVI